MNSFLALSKMNLKLFVREPIALFFTIIFPLISLIVFGVVYGNTPDPDFSPDFGFLDYEFPAVIVMAIGTMALLSIPIGQATGKELGIHRRFQATPVKPITYFSAELVASALVTIVGCIVMYIVAELLFDLRFETSFGRVLFAFILSLLALFSFGYAVSAFIKTNRTATAVGNILLFPSLFFAGVFMPVEMMPKWVQAISPFIPVTHIVNLMRGAWLGKELGEMGTELVVTIGTLLVGLLIASLFWNREISLGGGAKTTAIAPTKTVRKKSRFQPKTQWVRLFIMHLKLYLREPISVFFTLVFPIVILFVFGSMEPVGESGVPEVDRLIPGYFGMIITTLGLMHIPIDIATWKEKQIIRRFQVTPYPLFNVFSALGVMYLMVITVGSLMLYSVAKVVYNAQFHGSMLELFWFFVAYALSSAVMILFGILIATVVGKASIAQAVGMVLFFPMLFLSGATIPQEIMPDAVVNFAQILPLTHITNAMRGAWIGEFSITPILILVGMLAVLSIVTGALLRK